ncbi:MAG: dUTP diphosphatase [Deltaproteobacteria bacterium]|nr:dUTP diphosphatase [Deltaproteobacteria bacterium]
MTPVRIRALPGRPSLPFPAYQTPGASGLDLLAAEARRLEPLERALVGTGLAVELSEGLEAQIRPRSGLALKHGVTVLNAPGTIDRDYRGELKVLLVNLGREAFDVAIGDRIAQLVVAKVERVELIVADELEETSRGVGGFGHTGR